MWKEKIGEEDKKTLREIVTALGEIGSQLDAADKLRGHDPWHAIASQEARIKDLARLLSDRFRRTHSDLVRRLSACENLHLVWASLQDEIEQTIR
jgi:hypothetical protein